MPLVQVLSPISSTNLSAYTNVSATHLPVTVTLIPSGYIIEIHFIGNDFMTFISSPIPQKLIYVSSGGNVILIIDITHDIGMLTLPPGVTFQNIRIFITVEYECVQLSLEDIQRSAIKPPFQRIAHHKYDSPRGARRLPHPSIGSTDNLFWDGLARWGDGVSDGVFVQASGMLWEDGVAAVSSYGIRTNINGGHGIPEYQAGSLPIVGMPEPNGTFAPFDMLSTTRAVAYVSRYIKVLRGSNNDLTLIFRTGPQQTYTTTRNGTANTTVKAIAPKVILIDDITQKHLYAIVGNIVYSYLNLSPSQNWNNDPQYLDLYLKSVTELS